MALTPALAWLGAKFEEHMEDREMAPAEESESTISDMRNHVIIAGFGRVGQSIAKMLTAADIPMSRLSSSQPGSARHGVRGCRFFMAMRAGWKCSGR